MIVISPTKMLLSSVSSNIVFQDSTSTPNAANEGESRCTASRTISRKNNNRNNAFLSLKATPHDPTDAGLPPPNNDNDDDDDMYKRNALSGHRRVSVIYMSRKMMTYVALNKRQLTAVMLKRWLKLAVRRVRAKNRVRNTSRPTTEGILLPQTANPSFGGPAPPNKVEGVMTRKGGQVGAYGNGGP